MRVASRSLLATLEPAILLIAVLALAACQTPPGEIFPLQTDAPRWPAPPDETRVIYVGQLATSEDLKPGVSGWEAFGQAVFGKPENHAMLSPMAVCTDNGPNGGRVFVADSNAQCVHVFDLNTRKYAQWRPPAGQLPFGQPVGIAWDAAAGRLFVADSISGAVLVFDSQGNFVARFGVGKFERPVGIAVDPRAGSDGRIFVADAKLHQVIILNRAGDVVARLGKRGTGPGEFNFPTNVAFDPDGLLYVSDSLNFRVQVFDRSLGFVRQIGRKGDTPGNFAQPRGIATDSEGHLYVIDNQFENVQLFDGQGRMLMDFGEEGIGRGQFWLPPSMFIDARDRIWVADRFNKRVQVFDYLKGRSENGEAPTRPTSGPSTATSPAQQAGTQAETKP